MYRVALVSFLSIAAAAAAQPKPKPTITEGLASVKQDLTVDEKGLRGPGAEVILDAVHKSRLVAIGEDHVTNEVPLFVSALCAANRKELSGLVLEVGPRALSLVRPSLSAPDRVRRIAAFNARYPAGLAFLDTRADNDMVSSCLAEQPGLKVIGIDQEFLGSAGLLLDLILAEKLSPPARAEVDRLREADRQGASAARKSGNPSDLLLLAATDEQLARAEAALKTGGNARARSLFAELQRSRKIYRTDGNASNQDRAKLLKSNLRAQLPATGKVLIKMGDWHMYRGYNPLNNRDVGNWVSERADEEGPQSLHILVLGARGTHALYGGYDRPLKFEPFVMAEDRDYKWIQAAVDAGGAVDKSNWSLFDLRRLRDRPLSGVDVQWRRVLDGFDLLVVIPNLTPSNRIGL